MAWQARVMTGEEVDPAKLNPYRQAAVVAPPAKSESDLAAESAAAWKVLGRALGG